MSGVGVSVESEASVEGSVPCMDDECIGSNVA